MDGEKLLFETLRDEAQRPGSQRRKKALNRALTLAAAVYLKSLYEKRTQAGKA